MHSGRFRFTKKKYFTFAFRMGSVFTNKKWQRNNNVEDGSWHHHNSPHLHSNAISMHSYHGPMAFATKIMPHTLSMKTNRNQCLGRYGSKHRFATELLDCINILNYIAFLPFLPVGTIVVRCDFQCNLIFLYTLQQGLKRDFHHFLQYQCRIQILCH